MIVMRQTIAPILLLLAVSLLPPSVAAQELSSGAGEVEIATISVNVEGVTQVPVVRAVIGIAAGDRFGDIAALERSLARARQLLLNRRVFASVAVGWAPAAGESGRVDVFVEIIDGQTLLAVPFYRYGTNSGHNPLFVLFWNNAFGSLTDLELGIGYYSRDWVTPFRFEVVLGWRGIRWLGREWSFAARQEFVTVERAAAGGIIEFAYTYWSTNASFSTSFALTPWLRYGIAPGIVVDYNHRELANTIGEAMPASRTAPTFSHGLSTGNLDWIGNLRDGAVASLGNGLIYDPVTMKWGASLRAVGAVHHVVDRWGASARLLVDYDLAGDAYGRAGELRGVPDNRMAGQLFGALTTDLSLDMVDIRYVGDVVFTLFMDIGATRKEAERFGDDDFAVGLGVEVLVFPDIIRGLVGRFTLGALVLDVFRGEPLAPAVEFTITNALPY